MGLEPATIQQQQLQPQCEQHPRARRQEALLDDSTDNQSTLDHQTKKFQQRVIQFLSTRSTTAPSPPPIGRYRMPLPAAAEAANNRRICNYSNTASNHQGDTHTTTNQDRATPKHPDLDDMIRDDKADPDLRKARWERHYPIVEGEMVQEKFVDSDM